MRQIQFQVFYWMNHDRSSSVFVKRFNKDLFFPYHSLYNTRFSHKNQSQLQKTSYSLKSKNTKQREFRQKQPISPINYEFSPLKFQKTTKINSSFSPQRQNNDVRIRYKLCTSKNVAVFLKNQSKIENNYPQNWKENNRNSVNKLKLLDSPEKKLGKTREKQGNYPNYQNEMIKYSDLSPRHDEINRLVQVNFKMRKVLSSENYRKKQVNPMQMLSNKYFDPWINQDIDQNSDILFYK